MEKEKCWLLFCIVLQKKSMHKTRNCHGSSLSSWQFIYFPSFLSMFFVCFFVFSVDIDMTGFRSLCY